ncbi:MAG: carbohydrate-binding protein [Chitinophagaceae bacterium]
MKVFILTTMSFLVVSCLSSKKLTNAWNDKAQLIPGKLECEFYDIGGEGIAYHDSDEVNNGSGKLNPVNGSFLNEFRMKEGVDISYTKTNNVDNNTFNRSEPLMNQLYVGWTQPGEWINYTVNVETTAKYQLNLMYTANGDGVIALDLDGKSLTGNLKIISTHDDRDTIAWRQWHHWAKMENLATVYLHRGKHRLTLHVIGHGNMNFDYFDFIKQ